MTRTTRNSIQPVYIETPPAPSHTPPVPSYYPDPFIRPASFNPPTYTFPHPYPIPVFQSNAPVYPTHSAPASYAQYPLGADRPWVRHTYSTRQREARTSGSCPRRALPSHRESSLRTGSDSSPDPLLLCSPTPSALPPPQRIPPTKDPPKYPLAPKPCFVPAPPRPPLPLQRHISPAVTSSPITQLSSSPPLPPQETYSPSRPTTSIPSPPLERPAPDSPDISFVAQVTPSVPAKSPSPAPLFTPHRRRSTRHKIVISPTTPDPPIITTATIEHLPSIPTDDMVARASSNAQPSSSLGLGNGTDESDLSDAPSSPEKKTKIRTQQAPVELVPEPQSGKSKSKKQKTDISEAIRRSRRSTNSRAVTPTDTPPAPTLPDCPPTPPPVESTPTLPDVPPTPPGNPPTPTQTDVIAAVRDERPDPRPKSGMSGKKGKGKANEEPELPAPVREGREGKRKAEEQAEVPPGPAKLPKITLKLSKSSASEGTPGSSREQSGGPPVAPSESSMGKRKSEEINAEAAPAEEVKVEEPKINSKKPTGRSKTRRNVVRSESPEEESTPAIVATPEIQEDSIAVKPHEPEVGPAKKKAKRNNDGVTKATLDVKAAEEASASVVEEDTPAKGKPAAKEKKQKQKRVLEETVAAALPTETSETSESVPSSSKVPKEGKAVKVKVKKTQDELVSRTDTSKPSTASPAPAATPKDETKLPAPETKSATPQPKKDKPETPILKRSLPQPASAKSTPDPTSSLFKKKKPLPAPKPVEPPSLLQSTLAALHNKAAQHKDEKEKEKKVTKKKGHWDEVWVMTAEQQKEYDASAPQREAERKARAAYSANAVNLQEAKDAYRRDSLKSRVLPPVGIRLTEETRPSILIGRMRAHVRGGVTSEKLHVAGEEGEVV